MPRPNVIQVRLTDEELKWLKDVAQAKQLTPAEVVRQFIQSLDPDRKPS